MKRPLATSVGATIIRGTLSSVHRRPLRPLDVEEPRIGCSGWNYASWKGGFYPKNVPSRRWLQHYAGVFDTVEANGTFYRLPEAAVFEAWRRELPKGFVMAVKASRFLTHMKRLRNPQEPLERLISRASALGRHLGPLLYQLPPNLHLDLPRLGCLPGGAASRLERPSPQPRDGVPAPFMVRVRNLLAARAARCVAVPSRQTRIHDQYALRRSHRVRAVPWHERRVPRRLLLIHTEPLGPPPCRAVAAAPARVRLLQQRPRRDRHEERANTAPVSSLGFFSSMGHGCISSAKRQAPN